MWAASSSLLGAHAEYLCLPEDGALCRKPSGAAFEEAAAITEGCLTALPFLRDTGRVQPGQAVLIFGASGSVGASAVQLARFFGAEVSAVCSTRNLELVKSLGADQVIDYTTTDFTANGKTYDIVFDTVAKSSFARSRGSLKPGGVYLTTVPSLALLLQVPWTAWFGSRRAKIAFTGLRPPADKAKDLELLVGLVDSGAIRAVIDECFPMERAAAAHALVDTGHKRGSVVLCPSPPRS